MFTVQSAYTIFSKKKHATAYFVYINQSRDPKEEQKEVRDLIHSVPLGLMACHYLLFHLLTPPAFLPITVTAQPRDVITSIQCRRWNCPFHAAPPPRSTTVRTWLSVVIPLLLREQRNCVSLHSQDKSDHLNGIRRRAEVAWREYRGLVKLAR